MLQPGGPGRAVLNAKAEIAAMPLPEEVVDSLHQFVGSRRQNTT
jgi:hypothetical protein